MFRKLIFTIVLVAAAFAGGAAINGPGLVWLQRTFAGGPSIIVDNSQPPAPKPPKPFPTAKTSSLQGDLKRLQASKKLANASPAISASPVEDPGPSPSSPSPPAVALLNVADPSTALDDPTRLAASSPLPIPNAMPPLEFLAEPGSTPSPASAKSDPVARMASASTSVEPSKDWAEIRGRMKNQGIARYSIEAEIDGRVKFSCVIPVDGLRAVGHHFEAEGDDEVQAIEAGLKRVALWRATESK